MFNVKQSAPLIRSKMLEINKLIGEKAFKSPVHLALGHEAIAVALAEVIEPEDRIVLTHRNIHYHLALGVTVSDLCEAYNQPNGSMNFSAGQVVYTSSILANNLPVAVGIALANPDSYTWAVTGDGAMEEGAFYESVLLAKSLDLSLIFIVENNDHSLATKINERRCHIDVAAYAAALGCGYARFSGGNVTLYAAALKALKDDPHPVIVEVMTRTLGKTPTYHAGFAPETHGLEFDIH